MKKALATGTLTIAMLLLIYLVTLSFVSGFSYAKEQFARFWYFIVPLSVGFGIQIGLFFQIRQLHKKMSIGMVATTGTTTTISMVSCCSHYLINMLPILGTAGIISLISSYQVQLFWAGLVFNFAGIIYMANSVYKLKKTYDQN